MSLPLSDSDIDTLLEIDRGQRDRVRRRQEPSVERSAARNSTAAPANMAPTQSPPVTPKGKGLVDRNGVQIQPGTPVSVPMPNGKTQTIIVVGPGEAGTIRVKTERGSLMQVSQGWLHKGEVPAESIPKAKPTSVIKPAAKPIAQKSPQTPAGPASSTDANGASISPGSKVVLPPAMGGNERVLTYVRMNQDGSAQMTDNKGHNFAMPASVLGKSRIEGTTPPTAPTSGTSVAPTNNTETPQGGVAGNSPVQKSSTNFYDTDGTPISVDQSLTMTMPDGSTRLGKATGTFNGKLMIAWDDGQKTAYSEEDISGEKNGTLTVGASGQTGNQASSQAGASAQTKSTQQGVPQNALSKISKDFYIYEDPNGDMMIVRGHSINNGNFTIEKSQKLSPKEAKSLLNKYGNQEGQEYAKGVKVPQNRVKAAYNAFRNPPPMESTILKKIPV